jgi:hypothetical protein
MTTTCGMCRTQWIQPYDETHTENCPMAKFPVPRKAIDSATEECLRRIVREELERILKP